MFDHFPCWNHPTNLSTLCHFCCNFLSFYLRLGVTFILQTSIVSIYVVLRGDTKLGLRKIAAAEKPWWLVIVITKSNRFCSLGLLFRLLFLESTFIVFTEMLNSTIVTIAAEATNLLLYGLLMGSFVSITLFIGLICSICVSGGSIFLFPIVSSVTFLVCSFGVTF